VSDVGKRLPGRQLLFTGMREVLRRIASIIFSITRNSHFVGRPGDLFPGLARICGGALSSPVGAKSFEPVRNSAVRDGVCGYYPAALKRPRFFATR
jgi:hypothetical protein